MEVQNVMHMTGGQGKTSYAINSQVQKKVLLKAKPLVQATIIDLYCKTLPKCFTMAELGCSSGPNSLAVISDIIHAIYSVAQKSGHKSPEFQVILNDLPGNDFNTMFKYIPNFIEELKEDRGNEFGPCFVSAVPGSFYGRLFPSNSLSFVHSSYSAIHILSQIPLGIENKGHIHLSRNSPPGVLKAYTTQFQMDFKIFLSSRSQEIVSGGCMVLTFIGRKNSDSHGIVVWDLLTRSLRDMINEELVEEAKFDTFNWPGYYPSCEEVSSIIQEQGSFKLNCLETFYVDCDPTGENVAKHIRAVSEPMLVNHFGDGIIDDLFKKYAMHADEHLVKEKIKHFNLVICMTKV